jgi:phage shock protein E
MIIDFIKKWIGFVPTIDYALVLKNGGKIIDVRSSSEFNTGNIGGSIHIPLEQIASGVAKLNLEKNTPIITVCASGLRSGIAKTILMSQGYSVVYNGGSWFSLLKKIV